MAIYDITIEVDDPNVTPMSLRWLLQNAGEVLEITKWNSDNKEDK
ncbi:hypothetical protein UFOVP46_97 [uncultured Caudovirales phage]|uniref:Uncharacterized protein n=1 Tax=uncultured Caudovirales phage TaxID=2100421 RepID=A0A6J5KRB7_9CAUD|nr:hypothetical protein UFOVP46_97 [uncultured Caudovirales phage]